MRICRYRQFSTKGEKYQIKIHLKWSMANTSHKNRDLFFSWMINEDNERKKPVASSRTFRLWMAQATCVGEFTTKKFTVAKRNTFTGYQPVAGHLKVKHTTRRKKRRNAKSGKKRWGKPSRQPAWKEQQTRRRQQRQPAADWRKEEGWRGAWEGEGGWAMARQNPGDPPESIAFHCFALTVR